MENLKTEAQAHEENIKQLLAELEENITKSIIGPFGIAELLYVAKDGGNIPIRYKKEYKRSDYDNGATETQTREVKERIQSGHKVMDGYARKRFNKDSKPETDHAVSMHKLHSNELVNIWLTKDERKQIANLKANLVTTERDINRWKTDKSIEDLPHSNKENRPNVDWTKMHRADKKAKSHIRKEIAVKVLKGETTKELAKSGAKMAVRQAVGVVMHSTTRAIFVEARDSYKYGIIAPPHEELFPALSDRAIRIKDSAVDSIPTVSDVAGSALKGAISEIITFLLNHFVSTAKELVRIIRESLSELIKAFKLLLWPPKNQPRDETIKEALKIVAGVVGVSLGLVIEESIKAWILTVPVIQSFASEISAIISGIIAGTITAVVIYLINRVFEKLSMRFESQSLDMLCKNIALQEELINQATSISFCYMEIQKRLDEMLKTSFLAIAELEYEAFSLAEVEKLAQDTLNKLKN